MEESWQKQPTPRAEGWPLLDIHYRSSLRNKGIEEGIRYMMNQDYQN